MAFLLDKMDTLRTVERDGVLLSVTRSAMVEVNTGLGAAAMGAALDELGVPTYGDRLDNTFLSPGFSLIVRQREVDVIDEGITRVTINYENAYQIDNMPDRFDSPFMGAMQGEVRCNVQQKTSNLDGYGNQVVLYHLYPEDDPNFPNQLRAQGGEFSYFAAQRSFSITGIKETPAPWAIANSITGRVNLFPFSGEAPRTWLCVGCNWKPQGAYYGATRFYMTFDFQFDPDTWDPTVVFIDEVTGKPPPNLILNEGIKMIRKHQAVDFEWVIGTWISGG